MDQILSVIGAAASVVTAVGVFFAWFQLMSTKNQAITDFEDDLAREYRELTQTIPVPAFLGKELGDADAADALPAFYRYVDLSNEQIFLRQQGRIREETWRNWVVGIKTNLARPAFRAAWEQIKQESDSDFGELRKLEGDSFQGDPLRWDIKSVPSHNQRLQEPDNSRNLPASA